MHPRAGAGSPAGGQFAASSSGGGAATKPAPRTGHRVAPRTASKTNPATGPLKGTLAYDRAHNTGPGYDSPHGDPHVHQLQEALTRLGVTDRKGRRLVDDGKLGPLTTQAVKSAQVRLGMAPTGRVDAAFLAKLQGLKALPPKPVRRRRRAKASLSAADLLFGSSPAREALEAFNPNEPREPHTGKWGHGGPGAAKDTLKLSGRIKLDVGEHLVRSDVLATEDGSVVPVAWVQTKSGRTLRIGIGINAEDKKRWQGADRGNTVVLDEGGVAKLTDAITSMRAAGPEGMAREKALTSRSDALSRKQRGLIRRQYPNLSKAQAKELDQIDARDVEMASRIDSMREQNHRGFSELSPKSQAEWKRVDAEIKQISDDRGKLYEQFWAGGGRDRGLLDQAKTLDRQIGDLLDNQANLHNERETSGKAKVGFVAMYKRRKEQLDNLMEERDRSQARREELTGDPVPLSPQDAAELANTSAELERVDQERFDLIDGGELAGGVISGRWGDLAYEATMNDLPGVSYRIAVRRPNSPPDWSLGDDSTETEFTAPELDQLLKLLTSSAQETNSIAVSNA
jgi:hypothetical protein